MACPLPLEPVLTAPVLFLKAREAVGAARDDEGRLLMDDFDMLAAVARRARRRLRHRRLPGPAAARTPGTPARGRRPRSPCADLSADDLDAWAEVQRRGLEGLVAKPEASRYVPGARGVWRKVRVRREGVFALAGIAKDRDGCLMLVVGVREGRTLRFAGTVSFGVTRRIVAFCTRSSNH